MTANLERKIGLWAVVSLGVGTTIGTGIFSTMSDIASISGCGIILVIAFVVGGLLQIPANFCYAELASAYPEDGGYYVYIKEAGSKKLGFLFGWASFWALDPPSMSIIALGLVNYIGFLTHLDTLILRLISVLIIVFFIVINIRSVGAGSIVQTILTVLKVLPFLIVVGIGLFFLKENFVSSEVQQFTDTVNTSPAWILTMFTAIASTTFSYDGMYSPAYMAGEVKNPKKVLALGFITIAVIVVALYVLLSVASVGMLSIEDIANSSAPIAEVASQIPFIGNFAEVAVAVMAIFVIIGSLASAVMYQPRLGYSMAVDGCFFKVFAKVHPKYKSPYGAIIFHCGYAILLTFIGDLSDLLTYFTLITLIRNFATFATIFKLRTKNSYKPSYKAPGNLICPIISCILTGLLVIGLLIKQPIQSSIAIVVLVVTGLIAYELFTRKNS